MLHGYPGTGKSRVIAWMRTLMEDGLGWEHGVQCVYLSFQNTMAANIEGYTIHHWGGIDPTAADGSCTTKDTVLKFRANLACNQMPTDIMGTDLNGYAEQ